MVRNNIKVVGVSELWWLGQGRVTTDNENMFIFSGKESEGKRGGVGFIIEKETAKCVLGYDPISKRVIIIIIIIIIFSICIALYKEHSAFT